MKWVTTSWTDSTITAIVTATTTVEGIGIIWSLSGNYLIVMELAVVCKRHRYPFNCYS